MRILLTARRFIPPFTGGVDVYADRLARAWERQGHETMILAVDSNGPADEPGIITLRESYQGRVVHRLRFSLDRRPKRSIDLAYDPDMGAQVRQILRMEKPDLLVILNFYLLSLAAVQVAKEEGIPVIHVATDFIPVCRRATYIRWDGRSCEVGESIKTCAECFVSHKRTGRLAASVLGRFPEEFLVRWASRSLNNPQSPWRVLNPYWNEIDRMDERLHTIAPLRESIDLVFTPTQFTLRTFLENGFNPDQVHFLPFGIDPDNPLAGVRKKPALHTRFLFIGRLQPYKGAHVLIQAFNDLPRPKGATLTLYGAQDGYDDYYARLQTLMAANDRIHFAGNIDPAHLDLAFAEADYFILPSIWHENSPLILLDAIQSGTPVISSDIGGATDVVRENQNGLLFPMADHQALSRLLQRAIDQPELKDQLSASHGLLTIESYSQEVMAYCQRTFGREASSVVGDAV